MRLAWPTQSKEGDSNQGRRGLCGRHWDELDGVISNYVLKSETDLTDLSCERQGDDHQVNFQLIKCAQCLTEVHDTRDSGLVISDQLNCISEQVHRIDYLSFECEAIE